MVDIDEDIALRAPRSAVRRPPASYAPRMMPSRRCKDDVVTTRRAPRLTPEQAEQVRWRVAADEQKAAVARDLGMRRMMIYSVLINTGRYAPPGA